MRFLLLGLVLFSLITPAVFAYSSGISPLDGAVVMISNLFNIRSLQDNVIVREGFLKFMLFMVMFAVSNYSLLYAFKAKDNPQGKKTAGIVAFAFSMIGVFMMPTDWLMATGGTLTAVMSSVVFGIIFWGGSYAAVFLLRGKPDDKDKAAGWVKNLMGLMIILLLIMLLQAWAVFTRIPIGGANPGFNTSNFTESIYAVLVYWTNMLLAILLVVKIIQFFSGPGILNGLGLGGSPDGSTPDGNKDTPDGNKKTGGGAKPSQIKNFRGKMHQQPGMLTVKLEWDAPKDSEIIRYEIDRQPTGPSHKQSWWARTGYGLTRWWKLWSTWRRVGEPGGSESSFEDTYKASARKIIRPLSLHNAEILPYQSYEYRIRAVTAGGTGDWMRTVVTPLAGLDRKGIIAGRVVGAEPEGDHWIIQRTGMKLPLSSDAEAGKAYEAEEASAGLAFKVEAFIGPRPVATTGTLPNGLFTLYIDDAYFGQEIVVRVAGIKEKRREGLHTQGWPKEKIRLSVNEKQQMVIVPSFNLEKPGAATMPTPPTPGGTALSGARPGATPRGGATGPGTPRAGGSPSGDMISPPPPGAPPTMKPRKKVAPAVGFKNAKEALAAWRKLHIKGKSGTGGSVLWHYKRSHPTLKRLETLFDVSTETITDANRRRELESEKVECMHLYIVIEAAWKGLVAKLTSEFTNSARRSGVSEKTHLDAIVQFEDYMKKLEAALPRRGGAR
ncbi:fibronectin type III domain-containing protein [Candidatus Woesearchaeota archaeon]|nr:fibronectin type III domain-containing protein [Candidatus Woesearchaeota archaeon]